MNKGNDKLIDFVDIKSKEGIGKPIDDESFDYNSKPKRVEKTYTISWDIASDDSTDSKKI